MSDFLSPAINERLKEKRMTDFTTDKQFDYKVRRDFILAEFNSSTDLPSEEEFFLRARKKIDQLFLDTIEKAKPEERKDIDPPYDKGFNDCAWLFERSLKKEIGK